MNMALCFSMIQHSADTIKNDEDARPLIAAHLEAKEASFYKLLPF